ncbi:MAG: hypothetical protein AAB497_02020 [Patescibacteria group bacterium]
MSIGVQFDVDTVQHPRYKTAESKLVHWAMKYSNGLIKDERRANYVLIWFSMLIIVFSLFLIFRGGDKNTETIPEPFINKPQFLLK